MKGGGEFAKHLVAIVRQGELAGSEGDFGEVFALGANQLSEGGEWRTGDIADHAKQGVGGDGRDIELRIVQPAGKRHVDGDDAVSVAQ